MDKLAAAYCRVSSVDQLKLGRSMEEQEPMLRSFAAKENYRIVKVFEDKAKSATSMTGRDELVNALAFLKDLKKRNADAEVALIVQDTDRLARNELDYHLILKELKDSKIKLVSMNQPGINGTIEGELQGGIVAVISAFQSKITGRKVSNVKQRMIEQGLTTHRAPVGYRNINKGTADDPQRGFVEFDPVSSSQVRRMMEDYATGHYSFIQLAEKYNAEGLRSANGKPLQRSSIAQIIGNSYYIGKLKYNGKEFPGLHPKLIDEVLFERCKAMLSQRNNYAVRKRKPENHAKFFLKGTLECGVCDYSVTADATKGRNGSKYDYYHCGRLLSDKKHHSIKGECITKDELEKQIAQFFALFRLGEDVVNEVLERAKEVLTEMHGDKDVEVRKLTKEIQNLEDQRQNLEIAFLQGRYKGDSDFQDRNAERIETELNRCRARITEVESGRKDASKLFVALVKLARDLPQAYSESPPEVKRMYLTLFWDKFVLQQKKITKAVPSEAVIALINEKLITLNESPDNLFLIRKIWLPRLDSNQ